MGSSKGCVWWPCTLVLMALFTPHCPCYARPSPTKDSFGCTSLVAGGRLGGRSCKKWNNDVTEMFIAPGNDPVPVACTLEKASPGFRAHDISVRFVSISLDLEGKSKKINNQPHHVDSVTTDLVWLTRAQLNMEPIMHCQVRMEDRTARRVMRYVRASVRLRPAGETSPEPITVPKEEQPPRNHFFVPNNTLQGAIDSNGSLPPLGQGTQADSTPLTAAGNGSIPANEPDFTDNGPTITIVIAAAAAGVVVALLFVIAAAICVRRRRRKRRWSCRETPVYRASTLFGIKQPASRELHTGATDLVLSMSQGGKGGITPWNSSAGPNQQQQVTVLGRSADGEVSSPADAEPHVVNPATWPFTPRPALLAGGTNAIARSMSLPAAGQKPPTSAKKRPKSVHFSPDSYQAGSASCPCSPQSPPTTPQSPPTTPQSPPTTPQSQPAAASTAAPPQLLENKQSTMDPTGTGEEDEHQARQLPAQGIGRRALSLRQPGRQPIPGRAVPERTQSVLLPACRAAASQYPARQCRSQPDVAAATGQTSPASPTHIYNGTDWPWPLEIREAVSLSTLPTNHPALCASQPFGCSSQLVYVSHVLVGSQQQVQKPHQGSVQSIQGDHGEDQLQEQPPPAPQRPSSPPPPPPPPTQQPADDLRFECPVAHGNDDVCLIPVGEWSGVCVPGYYPSLTAVTPEPGRYWPGGYAYPASLPSQPLSPVAEANVLAESTLDNKQQSA